jgi:ATP-dependent Clp protease ATP-binding subunit ClpC
MVRLDMSEFQERHTVSRLVGAPPGYVGHEEAGKLTEAVRRRPYCVLLLDEMEKAHPDVFNVLLQVMDAGRLTDAQGRTVSFKHVILVLTSNAGADALAYRTTVGFQPGDGAALASQHDAAMDALRATFRPEFLNRIDEIVVFHPLAREQLGGIVERLLESTRRKLHGQAILLEVAPEAVDALVERGFEPRFGARPLRRAIQRDVETPLSRMMLGGEVKEGDTVRVGFEGGAFTFAARSACPRRGASLP